MIRGKGGMSYREDGKRGNREKGKLAKRRKIGLGKSLRGGQESKELKKEPGAREEGGRGRAI